MNRLFFGLLVAALLPTYAAARPVAINGVGLSPVIETKLLSAEHEGLPIWFLPRLGLQTRNDPQDIWLSYGTRSVRYTPQLGWLASGFSLSSALPAPERYGEGGSVHVGLTVLRALGVPLGGNAQQLNVKVRASTPKTPEPQTGISLVSNPAAAKVTAAQKAASTLKASKSTVSTPTLPKTAAALVPNQKVLSQKVPTPKTISKTAVQAAPKALSNTKVTWLPNAAPISGKSTKAVYKEEYKEEKVLAVVAFQPTNANLKTANLKTASVVPTPIEPAPLPSPTEPKPAVQPALVVVPEVLPASTPTPAPNLPIKIGLNLTGVRSSLTTVRNIQIQRVVIDLSGPAEYTSRNERGGVSIFVPNANAAASVQRLDSGDVLTLTPDQRGVNLRLDAGGGMSQVMTLENPDRIVIDTATSLSAEVPPPIKEDALPDGVTLKVYGGLSLLSFDPARYTSKVVSAPSGVALDVSELVRRSGGVAGINGGYFDPPSRLPVDFVGASGQMLAASLERRGTVGFDAAGAARFGFPRPRYMLSGAFNTVMVNTITNRPAPKLLTAFVGDGKTPVGGANLLTLTLNAAATAVAQSDIGGSVPAARRISLTFDPARFPQLPTTAGSLLTAALNYQIPNWQDVQDGLSAGPMLLQAGEVVLNPQREAFNVLAGVWRPTRQVAFAVYQGQPTLAFLDFGTPETFARALHSVGVQDALRLDSGSSASVFVAGGYLGTGGYINTVWGQAVPNAIVMVPVTTTAQSKAAKAK